jgi:hypothetical protein
MCTGAFIVWMGEGIDCVGQMMCNVHRSICRMDGVRHLLPVKGCTMCTKAFIVWMGEGIYCVGQLMCNVHRSIYCMDGRGIYCVGQMMCNVSQSVSQNLLVTGPAVGNFMYRVGQKHIYTSYIHNFRQGNHQIYGVYTQFWPTLLMYMFLL